MTQITASGVYNLSPSDYHGQPTDTLSMSASDAKIMTESTPAHLRAAWAEAEDDNSKEADFGTLVHCLILEPHREQSAICVIDAPDWRKKDAQEARDAARAAGRIPILEKTMEKAERARDAVYANPVAAKLLKDGKAEQSWFAKDAATGLYLKCRPDFFTADRIIVDVKTVGSASPEFLKRRVYDGGWFQQAPWYCDVVERVDGVPARGYAWLVVEQDAPHCVVIRRPPDTMLMHGHRLNQRAFAIFAKCAKENRWPGYSDAIEDLELPSYALFRLEEDGVLNEGKTGMEALAWHHETGASPFA